MVHLFCYSQTIIFVTYKSKLHSHAVVAKVVIFANYSCAAAVEICWVDIGLVLIQVATSFYTTSVVIQFFYQTINETMYV